LEYQSSSIVGPVDLLQYVVVPSVEALVIVNEKLITTIADRNLDCTIHAICAISFRLLSCEESCGV